MTNVTTPGPAVPPPPPVWNTESPGAGQSAYGGFWIRLVAYIIDAIVIDIVLLVGFVVFAAALGLSVEDFDEDTADPRVGFLGLLALGAIPVVWLYFALMESSARGATLGKMAVGLRVVTDQGQRVSFLNATGRYFAKIVSSILCIGFIMIAFTDRKRGLHDMMASTLVIKARQ